MNKSSFLLIVTLGLLSCISDPQFAPECLEDRIAQILEEDMWNPPASLYSYSYKGETVYFIPQHCCDFPSELYDVNCNLICSPDGGITGDGDGKCSDFFQLRRNEKLLWIDPRASCEKLAIVNELKFDNAPNGGATILSAVISGDCLTIQFGASGCSGVSWKKSLIGSPLILESQPPQRQVKFALENNEACAAYFTEYASFDITSFRVSGTQTVLINLSGYDNQLVYNY